MGVFSSPRVRVDVDGTASITVKVDARVDDDLAFRIEDHWSGGMVQGTVGKPGRRVDWDDDQGTELTFICAASDLSSKEATKATFEEMSLAWVDAVRERNAAAAAATEVAERAQKLAENYPAWP